MKQENDQLETLEDISENPFKGKTSDIKTPEFYSISSIMGNNNNNDNIMREQPPVTNPMNYEEKPKVNKKKIKIPKNRTNGISLGLVILIIAIINIAWIGIVSFVIIPDYQSYQHEKKELIKKIEILENKVMAIMGE